MTVLQKIKYEDMSHSEGKGCGVIFLTFSLAFHSTFIYPSSPPHSRTSSQLSDYDYASIMIL